MSSNKATGRVLPHRADEHAAGGAWCLASRHARRTGVPRRGQPVDLVPHPVVPFEGEIAGTDLALPYDVHVYGHAARLVHRGGARRRHAGVAAVRAAAEDHTGGGLSFLSRP